MKAISLVHFLVVLFIIDVVWCERKKSSTTCSPEQCVQGFNPLDCPDGTVYQEKVAMEGCCPGCVRFRGAKEDCRGQSSITFDITSFYTSKTRLTTGRPPIIQSNDCAPEHICTNNKCVAVGTYTCPNADDAQNPLWKPACDVDGSYKAVQCKTTGPDYRCFCYNKEGTRIFGFDWFENSHKMHCLCSRLVEELRKNPENKDMTYHCSSNGNFEPLQCNRNLCYCADVYTGQPTSFIVPQSLWQTLPCYNSTTMGVRYLKTCDSQSNALALVLKETEAHGSEPFSLQAPPCDPDGSYSSKQCEGSQCYCRTRANVNIGSYFTERNSASEKTQNCYCARDQVVFQDAGRTHSYLCTNGGNYNPLQVISDRAFCVDNDGFLMSQIEHIDNKCRLSCVECS